MVTAVLTYLRRTLSLKMHRRLFAVSDLHVDYKSNMEMVKQWRADDYGDDILILAGDVTDSMNRLQEILEHLSTTFHKVMYCPGNHELWIRSGPNPETENSITKFHGILDLCKELGVGTSPQLFSLGSEMDVWVVPLFSWYAEPEEDAEDSLYGPGPDLAAEEEQKKMWMDNHMCKWHTLTPGKTRSQYFADLNTPAVNQQFDDKPIITFSHFLPRRDLIKPSEEEIAQMVRERQALGLPAMPDAKSVVATFNFTRYAGARIIDTQLRKLGSVLHVYGHQHRNRDRQVDGVRYVSHCLGNERERAAGLITGLKFWQGPKMIWNANGMVQSAE